MVARTTHVERHVAVLAGAQARVEIVTALAGHLARRDVDQQWLVLQARLSVTCDAPMASRASTATSGAHVKSRAASARTWCVDRHGASQAKTTRLGGECSSSGSTEARSVLVLHL